MNNNDFVWLGLALAVVVALIWFKQSPAPAPVPAPVAPAVKPVLAYFSRDGCGPCKRLAKEMASPEVQVELAHWDVKDFHNDRAASKKYNVSAYPTLLVLMPGELKEVARQEGFMSSPELISWLAQHRPK